MSWPVPSSSGANLPLTVQLPWAARENVRSVRRPVVASSPGSRRQKASIRKAKYGGAMLAGLMAVGLVKRIVNSIPVLNIVTRPLLDMVPTILVGPALGAAVLYGMEKGDLLAARHVVREKAQVLRQEIDTVARDLSSELQARNAELTRRLERSQGALESTARVARGSVEEMERTVVPVLSREFSKVEAQARRVFQDANSNGRGPSGGDNRGR